MPNNTTWTPELRLQKAQELDKIVQEIKNYEDLIGRFSYYLQKETGTEKERILDSLRFKMSDLRTKCQERSKRLSKGVVKIGVIGLEKQGKSAFLSAWLGSKELLPSQAKRCTWSTTVVNVAEQETFRATVEFYSEKEFQTRVLSYFKILCAEKMPPLENLNQNRLSVIKTDFEKERGYPLDDPERAGPRERAAYEELKQLTDTITSVRQKLDSSPIDLQAANVDDLANQIRQYIALSDIEAGDCNYPYVRAVKLVTVTVPVSGAIPGVVLMDLPGIDAPSDKARYDTLHALQDEVDITIFVKDISRPSLVNQEEELLDTIKHADRSIELRNRMFAVLTKVDLFRQPDERGAWHWQEAVKSFEKKGLRKSQVFPYSLVWEYDQPDSEHPAMDQIMKYYGAGRPVSGLNMLREGVKHYLAQDLTDLDNNFMLKTTQELSHIKMQLRDHLGSLQNILTDEEFDRRADQEFQYLFYRSIEGESSIGLLADMGASAQTFVDIELSEKARKERAEKADTGINNIRSDMVARLTPESADLIRAYLRIEPKLQGESAVNRELRLQLGELFNDKIKLLGLRFREISKESVEKFLRTIFDVSFEGGSLSTLLPPGGSLLEQVDSLIRDGKLPKGIAVEYQEEMMKIEVAFEVLSRYFARQIASILQAVDEDERKILLNQLRGLQEFFGVKVSKKSSNTLWKSRKRSPSTAVGENNIRSEPQFEWTATLNTIENDLETILSFVDALATHERGLPKYHEEIVRRIERIWLGKSGKESLRDWSRTERKKIWPHKFEEIESQRESARNDMRSFQKLFGDS